MDAIHVKAFIGSKCIAGRLHNCYTHHAVLLLPISRKTNAFIQLVGEISAPPYSPRTVSSSLLLRPPASRATMVLYLRGLPVCFQPPRRGLLLRVMARPCCILESDGNPLAVPVASCLSPIRALPRRCLAAIGRAVAGAESRAPKSASRSRRRSRSRGRGSAY